MDPIIPPRRSEYKVSSVAIDPGREVIVAKHGITSFSLVQVSAGQSLELAEFIDGKQGSFSYVPFGLVVNFTSSRGVVLRNPGTTRATYRYAVADAPMGGATTQTQDGVNPSVSLATFQTTGVVIAPANGLISTNAYDGAVNTWFDASAFVGKYVLVFITTSAGLAGGNLAFEQSADATLDAAGAAWNLQDSIAGTDSQGSSLTVAASTRYRRSGVVLSPLIRIKLSSALTAGTMQIKFVFSNTPFSNTITAIRNSTGAPAVMVGSVSHSSSVTSIAPVLIGGRVFNTLDTTMANGDGVALLLDTSGRAVVNTEAPPELKWAARSGATPFSATADTAAAAAAGSSIRRRGRKLRIRNTSATAGALIMKDGTTEIDRVWLPASMAAMVAYDLDCRTSANAAFNIACSTVGMSVDYSLDGINEF
jgi:hypothetical protein